MGISLTFPIGSYIARRGRVARPSLKTGGRVDLAAGDKERKTPEPELAIVKVPEPKRTD
jgi:hypothetical protein